MPPGTRYHWYLLAHQRVKKIDADTYQTFMEGVKHRVAHRRPHWPKWSTGDPGYESEEARLVRILEEALEEAGPREPPERTARLEPFVEPAPDDPVTEDKL